MDFSPQFPQNYDLVNRIDLMILGEAPGAQEEKEGKPFVGASGKLLRQCLEEIGIHADDIYISNTFWVRPPNNDIGFFFSRSSSDDICSDLPGCGGKFLKSQWRSQIERLQNEIDLLTPKIIIAVGRIPLWALTGLDRISLELGKIKDINGPVKSTITKCVPIYHPAYILRNRRLMPEYIESMRSAIRLIGESYADA